MVEEKAEEDKTKIMKKTLILLFATAFGFAQDFYDLNTIQTIEITFAESNWDALLDAAEPSDGYIPATSVSINGTIFPNVGVKYKGNSSYNANQPKNPFHIELDTYENQDYQGYKDIKLSNVIFDPSFIREALSYKILGNYMDAPLANFAKVFVNGSYIGLYTNVESISKTFVENRFGSKTNSFFNCSPPGGASPQSQNLPNLAYLGTNSTSYETAYEMKSDTGWEDLIELTNTLSSNINNIENVLDVDRALWMLAFDNVLVNLDSYIGLFKQNYYLYKSDNGQFLPVVWDLNMSFGVFGMTGSPGPPLNSTTQKAQLSHLLHSTESNWPLVQKLLAVPTYKKRYLAHFKTILTEVITSGSYLTDAQALQSLINADVALDTNKFSYQSNIASNLTADISAGNNNTAPALSNLMSARGTFLSNQSDFTAIQPSISNVITTGTTPQIGDNMVFNATVTNSNSVYLAHRNQIHGIFNKTEMFDDGAHNDGAAGDNVYGAEITITSAQTQYYIYAENNTIGAFSPARAEHEFYSLDVTYPTLNSGDLVVNELMASNGTTAADPNGDFEDWFELYNNTSNTISLDNLYATDDDTNLLKWAFPSGLTIAPNSYLIVWADNDEGDEGLHANFKFSASGENCILSYPDGTILDSVTYGALEEDESYARVPNGTGPFVIQVATFNANNDDALNTNAFLNNDFSVYPNPAKSVLTIENSKQPIESLALYNIQGRKLFYMTYESKDRVNIDTSAYQAGIYLLTINKNKTVRIIKE